MSDPRVTILVPVLNGERTIGTLLDALRGQAAIDDEAEILIVDNGSTDGTRAVIEQRAPANVRVAEEARRGVAAARNRGLRAARGEIIVGTDADCVPSRRWLREMVAPFADPQTILVAGGLASYPPRTGAQRFAARYGLNVAERSVFAALPFANGRNLAVRRAAALAVGGWNEAFPTGEDIEFSHQVRQRTGCEIVFRSAAIVFHQDRAGDDELLRQARGYGSGMALLYEAHPDLLGWSGREKMLRARTLVRRRMGPALARIGRRLGRAADEDVEFADYLARWDRAFWAGFHGQRGASRR